MMAKAMQVKPCDDFSYRKTKKYSENFYRILKEV